MYDKLPELLPCPFCGEEARIVKDVRYIRPECEPKKAYECVCGNFDCIIFMADNKYFLTPEGAIEAWNRRAE